MGGGGHTLFLLTGTSGIKAALYFSKCSAVSCSFNLFNAISAGVKVFSYYYTPYNTGRYSPLYFCLPLIEAPHGPW